MRPITEGETRQARNVKSNARYNKRRAEDNVHVTKNHTAAMGMSRGMPVANKVHVKITLLAWA